MAVLATWLGVCAGVWGAGTPARAQAKPELSINEDCTSFAIAADGRLVYSVRHVFTKRPSKYMMERDDIWVASPNGKRQKIFEGEKFVRGNGAFSYQVHSLRWSPDGQRLVANLLTSSISEDEGPAQDLEMSLLLDAEGKAVKIGGGDNVIAGGSEATWLGDGATVAFLQEAMKPRLLFSINTVRPGDGATTRLFGNTAYAAVAWLATRNMAVAIERDAQLSRPPVLVLLDLAKQTRKELARLEEFSGGLSISPSGEKVAYYRDLETIEVRETAHPERVKTVRALVGEYYWSADERRFLLKPGAENKSNTIEWVTIENSDAEPILHGLTYRDFALSPDGRQVAVRMPGKGIIEVYPAQ